MPSNKEQTPRSTFRLSDNDKKKLADIAKHFFGTSDKMQTAALKLAIETLHKSIPEPTK